jgi:hypothetical protein
MVWNCQITIRNKRDKDAAIVKIIAQKPYRGLLQNLNLFSRTEIIAPPFDRNIHITGGERSDENIVVNPNETAVITILSDDPFFSLTVYDDSGCQFDCSFLAFEWEAPDYAVDEIPTYDPGVRILLTNVFPPGPDSGKTVFAIGETIYSNEIGLPKGTRYGFQVRDSGGMLIIRGLPRREALSTAKTGSGPECDVAFNQEGHPLKAGNYTAELFRMEDDRGVIIATANFSVMNAGQ